MVERKRAVVWVILAAMIFSLAGVVVGQADLIPELPLSRWAIRSPAHAAEDAAAWGLLEEVRSKVQENYVEPIPESDLLLGAVRGVVEATGDKYSVFMNKERYAEFRRHFDDSFGGIGVLVELKDSYVTVVRPLKTSPGERAGLLPGDRILRVDDRDITKLSLDEAVKLIRGPVGTRLNLTIQRGANSDNRVIVVTREKIVTPNTEHRMIGADIGYLQIVEFNENVGRRVRDALRELREKGMRGMVLDLRQNPGGLLDEAVSVSSAFVPTGPVVHIVDRDGRRKTYSSSGRGFDLPLVVLIDEGSASASEIVAGAIRDRGVGILVGAKSFGKGSVQTPFDLKDGSGLKLTTARYLTAGGESIHEKGIVPDIQAPTPQPLEGERPLALDDEQNPQLRRAIEVLQEKLKG